MFAAQAHRCGVLIAAIAGCAGSARAPDPELRATTAVTPARAAAPESPRVAPPPTAKLVTTPCANTNPLIVTENPTGIRGDLCTPALRSLTNLPYASLLTRGKFELRVRLAKLVVKAGVECKVTITVIANGSHLLDSRASLTMPGDDRAAARACVDKMIDRIMIYSAGPAMQQHAATTPAPAGPGPTTIP